MFQRRTSKGMLQLWFRRWSSVLLAAVASCRSPSGERGGSRQQLEYDDLRAEVVGVRVHEFAELAQGVIETAADDITARSSDPMVQRNARLWKMNAIPAFVVASFRPQPIAGFLDAWALSSQMRLYFESGAGKDAFGDQQEVAVRAAERLSAEMGRIVQATLDADKARDWNKLVGQWVERHPLESLHFARESLILEFAEQAPEVSGAFAAAVSIERQFTGLSKRLNTYLRLLPKQARWQVELAASSLSDDQKLVRASGNLDAVAGALTQVATVAERIPDIVEKEHAAIVDFLRDERATVLGTISKERIEALKAITDERLALIEEVRRQRASLMTDVEEITKGMLRDSSPPMKDLIDHFFWRVIEIGAVAVILSPFIYWVLLRLSRRRRGAGP
jgi:hypothetical protein